MTGASEFDRVRDRPFALVLAAALLSVLTAGCNSVPAKPSYPSTRLEGTVTVDNHPIASGTVQFLPPQGSKAPVVEAQIKDGRYVAENVPVGKVRVLFTSVKETGRADTKSTSQPVPEVVNIIPERYRDGMDIEVTADSSKKDFDLKTR